MGWWTSQTPQQPLRGPPMRRGGRGKAPHPNRASSLRKRNKGLTSLALHSQGEGPARRALRT